MFYYSNKLDKHQETLQNVSFKNVQAAKKITGLLKQH